MLKKQAAIAHLKVSIICVLIEFALRETSGKDTEPPVLACNNWSRLNCAAVGLVRSHSKSELNDDEDDSEDQDSTRPGLGPELLGNRVCEVGQNDCVEGGEDDCSKKNGILLKNVNLN